MNIKPCSTLNGTYRTGHLENITVEEITKALGFAPNVADDPYKVVNSWSFVVDNNRTAGAIWDYKGSQAWGQFSTYGDEKTFRFLFGDKYVQER
jgi:hypothetical protein